MFQSFIITGQNFTEKFQKIITLLPFELNDKEKESLISFQISLLPDMEIITSEKSIGIAEVRKIEKNAFLKPYLQTHKVIILSHAEKLTLEAQNALLKILEEPPSHLLFFLLSDNEDQLLPTIQSRCQIIKIIGRQNQDKQVDLNMEQTIGILLSSSLGNKLQINKSLSESREMALNFLNNVLLFFRQLLLDKNLRFSNKYPNLNSLANNEILRIIKMAQKTKNLIEKNVNTKLALDNFILSWPKL